jgi:hypothetical protein
MNDPTEPNATTTDSTNRSELLSWFGWTWLIAGLAIAMAAAAGFVLSDAIHGNSDRIFAVGVLPPLLLLGLLIYAWLSGRRQMALGVLAAMGSMFALVLLLVAACFGFVASGGFR